MAFTWEWDYALASPVGAGADQAADDKENSGPQLSLLSGANDRLLQHPEGDKTSRANLPVEWKCLN